MLCFNVQKSSDNVIEEIQNKLQDIRNPMAAMMVLLREMDLETDSEFGEGAATPGRKLLVEGCPLRSCRPVRSLVEVPPAHSCVCVCVFPCRSEHQNQPVPAVRQQLCGVGHLPGRLSPEHDQSLVLQRPADPSEALPALWRQRTSTTQPPVPTAARSPVASSRVSVCVRCFWAEAPSCCSCSRT